MHRIVIISDTHNRHREVVLPKGDIVVHCGDVSVSGSRKELDDFADWFSALPFRHKLMVGGNHDDYLEFNPELITDAGITFMWDSGVNVEGLSIYGSPYRTVPEERVRLPKAHHRWSAFMITETWAEHVWNEIPVGLDLLVTHQPPRGILDVVDDKLWGSYALRTAVARAKPRVHVFGHIHSGYGQMIVGPTTFINAATCDGSGGLRGAGEPSHLPVVIDL